MMTFQTDKKLKKSIEKAAKEQDRTVSNFIRRILRGVSNEK